MSRYIGSFAVCDAAGGLGRRVGDVSTEKHCASFHGDGYHSEREGNDLRIYHTTDDYGNPPLREEGNAGVRLDQGIRTTVDHGYNCDQSPAELNMLYARTRGAVGIRPSRSR